MTEIMTEKEVAELLKIAASTLGEMRRTGKGPAFIKVGGSIRYRRATVEKWLRDQERRRL